MMRFPPRITACAVVACALLVTGACAEQPPPAGPPEVDRAEFETSVYPLLLRDCGFPACHGDHSRFFQAHGPNRTRLDPATALDDPPSRAEIDAAYERARSMLASAATPEEALLLRKPLEVDLGGAPHMGIDAFGRDVYATREANGYQILLAWASGGELGEPMPPPPGEDAGGDDAGADDAGVDGADAGVPDAGGGL